MKRQRPIAIGIIFALVLSLLAPLSESLSRVLNADIITANAMSTDEYGTESNPYRILQIVPNSSMGTMKYLLSGFDKYTKNSSATYGLSDITYLGDLISDGEDTILRYEETDKEYKLDPTSGELATGDWEADDSIEFNHVNGYYQYTTTGDYKLDSATDGYVYSGPGAQYLPNVLYYTDDISVGNLDFNVIFSYDDGTVSGEKYIVKEEVPKEGGDYKKASFYVQDNSGNTCPRFMLVTGETTKQRYSVDTVTKNENGFYIEDEGRYTFNDTQMNDSKESRCDVTFKADDAGDYYIANMWAPREEDGPLYRYSMPDYYIFDKGNGDYDVTFTHLEGSTSEYTYTATASISEENGNYAAVLDATTPYREVVPGETGYYKFSYLYRFSYDKGNGQYSFTEANIVDATELPQPLPETLVDTSQKFWLTNQTIYREGYVKKSYRIVNNDLLKRYFIGLDSKEQRDNYYIEITTFTPTELNSNVASSASSGTLNALQTANLIYVTDYFDSKLTKLAEITPSNANYSESNDISADVALKLVECVTGKDTKSRNPGLILDYKESAYSNANSSTKVNMYKFIAAGALYGIAGFYNFFLNDYNGTATPALTFSSTFTKTSLIPHEGTMKGLLGLKNVDLVQGSGVNKFEVTRSVIENVYFNAASGYSESLLTNLNNEIYTSSNHSTYAKAFADAKQVIDNDTVGRFASDKRLTPAALMYYVANYRTDYDPPVDKETLKVLDIEPCKDFTSAKSSFKLNGEFSDNSSVGNGEIKLTEGTINYATCTNVMKIYFRSILKDFYGPIEIVEQTSPEFIGEVGDLNTMYDVIYFGLNTGNMNTVSSSNDTLGYGWTQYNDSRLDGLIYMHVGDRAIAHLKLGGIKESHLVTVSGKSLPTELDDKSVYSSHRGNGSNVTDLFNSSKVSSVVPVRYSGNDLTKVMVNKLKEYVNAGYCILAESALYNCNNKYIDDSSNIFNFFKDVNSYNNVIDVSNVSDDATKKKLEKAIGYEKIKIHLSEKPKDAVNASNVSQYNDQMVDGKKAIKFTFTIEDDNVTDAATYTAQIYIDSDADGFYETKADGSNEVVRTRTNLKKNTEYTMYKTLTNEYTGVVAWCLKIFRENDNNGIYRAQQAGYTCFKDTTTSDKTVVRVLQITSDMQTVNSETWLTSDYVNMEQMYYSSSETKFKKYASNLEDFTFMIDTISVSNLVAMYMNVGQHQTLFSYNTETREPSGFNMLCNPDFKDVYFQDKNYNGIYDGAPTTASPVATAAPARQYYWDLNGNGKFDATGGTKYYAVDNSTATVGTGTEITKSGNTVTYNGNNYDYTAYNQGNSIGYFYYTNGSGYFYSTNKNATSGTNIVVYSDNQGKNVYNGIDLEGKYCKPGSWQYHEIYKDSNGRFYYIRNNKTYYVKPKFTSTLMWVQEENVVAETLTTTYEPGMVEYVVPTTPTPAPTVAAGTEYVDPNSYNNTHNQGYPAMAADKSYADCTELMKTYYYDMIILGFGDAYSDIYTALTTKSAYTINSANQDRLHEAEKSLVDNLLYFIDTGRGVMFSHDTTSYVNQNFIELNRSATATTVNKSWKFTRSDWPFNNSTNWGYAFNNQFRSRLATDRFCCKDYDTFLVNQTTFDTPTAPSQAGGGLYSETQGFSNSSISKGSLSMNWNGSSGFASWYSSTFGIAFSAINDSNGYNKYGNSKNRSTWYVSGNNNTNKITKVNDGQITSYPYKLGDTLTVSQTHAPYYQLNMEQKGITVWYTMAYDTSNGNTSSSAVYGESPNDVVNNYYLYSVGNIMYTGSGHRNFKDYDDEVKLFINTIVAAYVPEKDPGRIEIENGVGQTIINNEKVIIVYAYFDADNESVPVAGTRSVDIEFFVDDSNLDSDENSIFYVKEGDTDITGQVELYDEAGNKILLSGSQYSVAKGYTYTLKVPIEFLCDPSTGLNNDSRMITLFAQPAVDTISQKIKIIRRSIFDLN